MKYPPVRFAVMADPHYYSPSLGISGPAFDHMLATTTDIKLLADSAEIVDAAVQMLVQARPDFLLVCGDLTKDGERVCHEEFAARLAVLQQHGIAVYVINGNHDINNQHGRSYAAAVEQPVSGITHVEFQRIYSAFGPADALDVDPHSLSYLTEPVPGLWLLALDSCRWEGRARVGGRLRSGTLRWALRCLERARASGKAVIGMMHHGLLEHYPGNRRFYPDYLIANDVVAADVLARGGLPVVFTGHFHAQDVQRQRWPQGHFVYDIETSSLATYPCSLRWAAITPEQQLQLTPWPITSTSSHPENFAPYARRYCYDMGVQVARRRLRRLGVQTTQAAHIAPQVIDAFEAHCTGNEQLPQTILDLTGANSWARFIMRQRRPLLEGLWAQQGPADNTLTIDLNSGEWSRQ